MMSLLNGHVPFYELINAAPSLEGDKQQRTQIDETVMMTWARQRIPYQAIPIKRLLVQ